MNRTQKFSILAALVLFAILYFGFDTKAKKQKEIEKTRSFGAEMTGGQALINAAKKELDAAKLGELELLELKSTSGPDSVRLNFMKQLAGRWYSWKRADISGHYALQIAEAENTEESWSLSGTTFSLCLQQQTAKERVDFCRRRAISSFENVISMAPENPEHRVNLAMVYANHPDPEEPMKGIQMLLGMNKEYPENVLVLKTLAKFGIQTGQFEKALGRLEKAKKFDEGDREIDCLLAEVHERLGNKEKAVVHSNICNRN